MLLSSWSLWIWFRGWAFLFALCTSTSESAACFFSAFFFIEFFIVIVFVLLPVAGCFLLDLELLPLCMVGTQAKNLGLKD